MKKQIIAGIIPGFMFLISLSSCFHNHDISISISDDEDEYEMDASFKRSQTHTVQAYLNNNLLYGNEQWHRNNEVEKEITLDDKTTFYMDAHPGELRIKIDRSENSEESFERIKQVCEDIKDLLADND